MMTNRQKQLSNLIEMALECEELSLLPNRRAALEDAVKRLEQGFDITHQQSGYWSQVTLQIRKDDGRSVRVR